MKRRWFLSDAEKEGLLEYLQREEQERMVAVERLEKLFPSDLRFAELGTSPEAP